MKIMDIRCIKAFFAKRDIRATENTTDIRVA
jgi:hypothetical protein